MSESTEKAYGPSTAAMRAAASAASPGPEAVGAIIGLDAAHDPALRVRDRSFNGGYVIDWLTELAERSTNPGIRYAIEHAAHHFEDAHAS